MTEPQQRNPSEADGEGIDPEAQPGDAAEEPGIVDQQAVAVQAVHEAEADEDGSA
ncbi:MAG: hypothetical protein Q8K58_15850 [Acidimicrobiales bacterium]|nr:hypothetical protein [Acidimicrobiales bacterium]